MRSPAFWYPDDGRVNWPARFLHPIGQLYAAAGELKHKWTAVTRTGVPVLCVGNLSVGGTGKTPLTLWLAKWLTEVCEHPQKVILTVGADLVGCVPDNIAQAVLGGARTVIEVLLGETPAPDPLGPAPDPSAPDISALLAEVRGLHGLG